MAGRAFAAIVEVILSGFRVSRYDIFFHVVELPVPNVSVARVQECGYVGNLLRCQAEFRHAFIRPPTKDDGSNQLTVLVMVHQKRADQVRTAIAAICFFAMTEAAGLTEQSVTAIDGRLIWRWGWRV
jgi:hypothetical protein